MSISVLPQLLEVDSELSTQADALSAQLNQLQEKRKGIQTVIAMFESGMNISAADIATVASVNAAVDSADSKPAVKTAAKTSAKTSAKAAKSAEKTVAKSPKTTAPASKVKVAKSRAAKAKAVPDTKVKATRTASPKADIAKNSAKSIAKSSETSKSTETTKRSGRTANWQRFVKDSYSKAPLPNVIVGVLQAQPNNIFKIADVMSAVFKEDMPKSQFLKARNRVSNILSAGARDGGWYRGINGTYSISQKAIKAVS